MPMVGETGADAGIAWRSKGLCLFWNDSKETSFASWPLSTLG